jgi:4-hydroxybenzoyl-CoA reductase subunit alpha
MRGHAAVQAVFAFESQLDMIAHDLGLDPIELRLKNARQTGDEIPTVTRVPSCGLSECIHKARESTRFDEKHGKLPDGRGIGIGCYGFFSGQVFNFFDTSLPYSEAWVKLNGDGTVNLFTLAADIGQGSDTVLSQIVAEELGINLEDVNIITSDTSLTPSDMGSWASRVTVIAGNAAKAAAADAKRQLFNAAASKLELKLHQQLDSKEHRVFIKQSPGKGISFAEAVAAAQSVREGMPIIGRGIFSLKGWGQVGPTFSFGAQVAEVEVDRETGRVKVLKVTTAHDCGRAINPMSVEGQLDGSLHMSLGYALSEELLIEKGKPLNPSLLDYKILSACDMPQTESIVVETDDPVGPYGAKEAGEGLTVPTAPAIANAIYDAIGVRIKDLPITPEKILKALKAKGK